MRIAQILGALGEAVVAVSASSSFPASLPTEPPPAASITPVTTYSRGISSTSVPHVPGSANTTIPLTTSTVTTNLVNATPSHTAGVTGGAIPQQMQASMAGLLGFCIMGLVML